MIEWPLALLWLSLFPLMAGMVSYRGALWCLERRSVARRLVLALALAAAAAGTGLLRLSGLLLLPGDNTWSVNTFDASWRDDGARYLQVFAGPLGGGALLSRRRAESRRQLNGKGSGSDGFS